MKLKKKRKSKRMRGTRYHGYAAKKHKGKGNVGGKGMAGTGKRASQKKTFILKYMKEYFGKRGKVLKKKTTTIKIINVQDIQNKYKPGEIILEGYKILGSGEIKDKFIVKAKSFSKQAKEKIEKAGGKALEMKNFEKKQ